MKDWQKLSALMLDALADEVAAQGRPTWMRVFDAPGEPEPSLRLELSSAPGCLMGWSAPDDCDAVGMVATGRARLADKIEGYVASAPDHPLDEGLAPEARFEFSCLLARDGTVGWTVRPEGQGLPPEPPLAGRMVDCFRRCFGMATDPPPVEPALLVATAWVLSVLETHTGAKRNRLTWSEVARLHPLARVISGRLPTDCTELVPGLCRLVASAWTWDDYRRLASQERCLSDLCEPELAAWMDDGMFARWILAALPAPEELLLAARPYLVPSAARRLSHAVLGAQRPLAGSRAPGG